jgi:hypothetical protein
LFVPVGDADGDVVVVVVGFAVVVVGLAVVVGFQTDVVVVVFHPLGAATTAVIAVTRAKMVWKCIVVDWVGNDGLFEQRLLK